MIKVKTAKNLVHSYKRGEDFLDRQRIKEETREAEDAAVVATVNAMIEQRRNIWSSQQVCDLVL